MAELNLDAESIARNKSYGAFEHLVHLIKIGWVPTSPLIKGFLRDNNLSEQDLANAIAKINEINTKQCCIDRNDA